MIKTTIELHRKKDTTANVSHMGVPFDGPAILDQIVEWSQHEENAGRRVYRHVVYSQDENVRHEPHSWGDSNNPGYVYPCKADYVTYLDIYHQ